jgi:hypothetical protein
MFCIFPPYVANQLVFYYPKIYDFYFPTAALNQFPGLKNLSENYRKMDPPFSSVQFINSLGGMQFTSFAKVSKFGKGLSAGSLYLSLFTSHAVRVCNDLNPYNNSNTFNHRIPVRHSQDTITEEKIPRAISFCSKHENIKMQTG